MQYSNRASRRWFIPKTGKTASLFQLIIDNFQFSTVNSQLPSGQFLVYRAEDGRLKLEVRLEDETVWLTQPLMADLFQTTQQNISQHILNIYEEEELPPEATHKKYLSVRLEGKREVKRRLDFYNLDMIISVGYRVKSHVATRFRMWATERLKEYIVKGFTLDDERLKNPDLPFDYFEELTRRIQDIRTSERRFYQKITDIYATSIDYDPTQEISITFFKTVQNKMHWAITGQTAAEIIHSSLTNFRGTGRCQVRCRFFYAAFCLSVTSFLAGFPGLRYTVSTGAQFRVFLDQRSGCFTLAAS